MQRKKGNKNRRGCQPWRVVVEPVGTPGQREQALRQAARYVLLRMAPKKAPPPPGSFHC